MADLPEPLTSADCDLRDFAFMPLDVSRLRRSKSWLYAKRDPAIGFYQMNLWTASWHEVPAASLEDDDDVLADLAMCDPNRWPDIRDKVLRGWIKCSDGRLYHPVVAEKANDSWARKAAQRERSRKGNSARWGSKGDDQAKGDDPPPDPSSGGPDSQGGETGSPKESKSDPGGMRRGSGKDPADHAKDPKGQGQREGEEEQKASPSAPAEPSPPPDARSALWSEGLARLRRITGASDRSARTMLGKLCRDARDDCALVSALLFEAERDRPGDPAAWLIAAIQARTGRRSGDQQPSRLGWMLHG